MGWKLGEFGKLENKSNIPDTKLRFSIFGYNSTMADSYAIADEHGRNSISIEKFCKCNFHYTFRKAFFLVKCYLFEKKQYNSYLKFIKKYNWSLCVPLRVDHMFFKIHVIHFYCQLSLLLLPISCSSSTYYFLFNFRNFLK